jgi:hypothetical protein
VVVDNVVNDDKKQRRLEITAMKCCELITHVWTSINGSIHLFFFFFSFPYIQIVCNFVQDYERDCCLVESSSP